MLKIEILNHHYFYSYRFHKYNLLCLFLNKTFFLLILCIKCAEECKIVKKGNQPMRDFDDWSQSRSSNIFLCYTNKWETDACRGVGEGWAGRAIAHPGFDRSVNQPYINQRGKIVPPTLLLAHPAFGSFLRPWLVLELRGCVPGSRALFLNAIKGKTEMSKKCRRNSKENFLDIKNAMSYANKNTWWTLLLTSRCFHWKKSKLRAMQYPRFDCKKVAKNNKFII